MSIAVRTAHAEDRAAVGNLLREFMAYLDAIEPQPAEPGLVDYLLDQSFGPAPVCSTLIADENGRSVGYAGYHPGIWEIHRSVYVISLFVTAGARGRGAGTALMEAVREIAAQSGARRVIWEVWRNNQPGIDFYRGLGAEVFDDNIRMALPVAERA